ncbi:hypothetical protein CTEN210_06347 [Chaetoceros tenuissimus]|uniref:Peptidase M11 gametolysin domain-containing protein n=1 Tax=Chaetoceros tenuissimus TaxID=426638 RepID=A0AAD3CPN8_9STRA|nr:hypothetical protein CTEN210_06347 [Chaetoceros tenuissimus]
MKFALPIFLASVALDSVTALGEKDTLRGRRQLKKLDDTCIASIVDVQYEDRTDDQFMTCETPSGKSYKVKAVDKAFIKKNFGNGKLMSGEVELEFDADAMIDESTAEIISKSPPGLAKKKKNNGNNGKGPHGRQLQTQVGNCGTYIGGSCAGTRSVLVVRVIAADKTTSASESQLAESVFANQNDSLNLQSWYNQCSYNQLNFVPASGTGINGGVTTVTVPSASTDGDSVMNNDIVTALNAKFSVSSPNQIANHVMYCLPAGTMNGIAYANINNWRSVYSDNWCTYVSAQAHEVGHNLVLAHSGDPAAAAGSSSATYGDQSGMMGFSYSNDDGPRQCFNAPKNWQLGWYDDKQISVSFDGWEGNLIGLSDYGNLNVATEDMVIAKVDLNESYYVSFNRKSGINSGTLEGGNQVMVHKRDLGTGYGESDILAYLNSGGTYSSPDTNFRVTVNSINLASNPATANVKIERFDNPPPCYDGTASVSITPDSYAGETTWDIRDDANNVLASGGSTGASNIVLANGYYTFSMYDSYGDGICCAYGNGSYSFQVGSTVVKTGGEFGSQESTQFGICSNVSPTAAPTKAPTSSPTTSPTAAPTKSPTPNPTVPPTNPPSPAPTSSPTTSPTAAPTKSPTPNPTVPPTLAPTSAPSTAPTSSPTAAPTKFPTPNPTLPPTNPPSQAPTSSPTNAPTAAVTSSPTSSGGCDVVSVEILTDNYPGETSWQLTDATSAVVLSGGGYTASSTTITSEVCVDDWTSLSFTINDSYGDGICCAYGSGSYTVTVNGSTVLSGGAFGSSETKPLQVASCYYGEEIVGGEVVCKCAPDEMRIAVDLTTDNYPRETSWTLSTCGGVELTSGSYTDSGTEHTDSICVPNNVPYRFQINDSYGDGICCSYGLGNYQISIDGTQVVSAVGDFGSSEVQDLNGVCSTNVVVSDPPLKCSSVTRKQDCLGNCEWVGNGNKNGKCTMKPKEEPTPKCAACRSTGKECCGTCVNNGPKFMRGCY